MRRKFAWIPIKRFITPIHRRGFLWLEWYWEVGGKAYKEMPEKIRVRLNGKGECVFITRPGWCANPPFNQYFECIRMKYSKREPLTGLGTVSVFWPVNLLSEDR